MSVLSRRQFLVTSATVLAAGPLVLGRPAAEFSVITTDLAAQLPAGARELGKVWRKADPTQGDSATAAAALLQSLGDAGIDLAHPAKLGEALRAQALEDFRAGRTAELGGWVLSVTELRLCALVPPPKSRGQD